MPRFGSHLSIAGGMVNALNAARELGMDCVQVFTKNQRRWDAKPLDAETIDAWKTVLQEMGWDDPASGRVVSHNSYLINMASPDSAMRTKSINAQRDEVERCETLQIPFLVSHPGAHLGKARPRGDVNALGEPPSKDELAGLKRIAKSLDHVHNDTAGCNVITCLETTVGSGTNLGYDFQHLAWLRDNVADPERIAFCLDTCHVTAAGYDGSTTKRAEAVLADFETTCGLANMRVIHLNDSIGALGSRLDRHAHIGDGCCGNALFESILNAEDLAESPMILETAKEEDADGRRWDEVNLERLRGFVRRGVARTTQPSGRR